MFYFYRSHHIPQIEWMVWMVRCIRTTGPATTSLVFFPGIHTGVSEFHNKALEERGTREQWAYRPAATSLSRAKEDASSPAHPVIIMLVSLTQFLRLESAHTLLFQHFHSHPWTCVAQPQVKREREEKGRRSGHSTLLFSVQFVTDTVLARLLALCENLFAPQPHFRNEVDGFRDRKCLALLNDEPSWNPNPEMGLIWSATFPRQILNSHPS